MTRNELIEQLAVRRVEAAGGDMFRELPEDYQQEAREEAALDIPLIVAFVAEWVEEHCRIGLTSHECAVFWEQEMSDGH